MADNETQTEMTTTANVLSYLVATARTGFTVPSEEGEGALYMLAKFADQTPEQMMETLQSDSATETLFDNDRLHTNLEIHSLIAGEPSISSILLNEGYNAYALHSNEAFQQLAHRIYDLDHGENAWKDRVRSEIEEIHGRDMSDEEYAARHELFNIAGEHGTQSDAFLTASKSYYELYPSNIRNREIEVNVRQYRDRVTEIERRIENIQSDDRLSPEDKEAYLFAQEISLTEAQQSYSIWAERWGQRMIRPIEKHDTPMRLAETLYERVTETDEFIVLARERYDALHFDEKGPNAWDQHFAELQAEYEASWFGKEPDYAAELTEWGQGHIDEKMGLSQFDLDKLAEHGVDTGIFDTLDGQTLLDDDEMLDVSSRFGTAWLQASEIAYDGRNGREPGAWATHFKDELTQAAGRTDSTSEARAIQELIAVADEHGSTSAEMMEAESAFLERFPDSVGSEAILDLNKELAREGEWALSYQDGNIGSALITDRYRSDEYKAAVSYLIKLDTYTEYEWFKDLSRDVAVGITDPTQYVVAGVTLGAGFYSGGTAAPVTAAGATTARAALVRGLTSAAAVSAVEGGVTEYSLGIINQKLDQELGVRESISQAEATTRGAFGAGMGSILGVGFFSAGRMTRRVFGTSNTPVDIPLTESNIPRVSRDGTVSAPDLTTAAARPVEAPETVTADIDVAAAAATPTATPRVTASDVVGIRDRLVNFARGFVAEEAGGISDTLASFGLAPLFRNIRAKLHAATAEPDIDGPAPRATDAEGPAAGAADGADGAARDGDAPEAGADAADGPAPRATDAEGPAAGATDGADGAARDGDAPEADADGPTLRTPRAGTIEEGTVPGRVGSFTNSKTAGHFINNMSKATKSFFATLDKSGDFATRKTEALRDLDARINELETSLNRFVTERAAESAGQRVGGRRGYPYVLTNELKENFIRRLSHRGNNNISGLQKMAVEDALNDMRQIRTDIAAFDTKAQVDGYLVDAAQRINSKNIGEPQDELIASTWDVVGLIRGATGRDITKDPATGLFVPGRVYTREAQAFERSVVQGTGVFSDGVERTLRISGNTENYGYRELQPYLKKANTDDPNYEKNLAQPLFDAYKRGMESDLFHHLENVVAGLGDIGADGTQSNPVPRFNDVIDKLNEIAANGGIAHTKDADGTITITDPHFRGFANRLMWEHDNVWEPNPQGTVTTAQWLFWGKHLDGGTFGRRENRQRLTTSSLRAMVREQYRNKEGGGLSDTDRSTWREHDLARGRQLVWGYLTGKNIDHNATYRGEGGFFEDPIKFRYAYQEPAEGYKFSVWKPWQQGNPIRRVATVAYRLSGMDLVPMLVRSIPDYRLGGAAMYLKSRPARQLAYAGSTLGLGATMEAIAGDDNAPWLVANHPAIYVSDLYQWAGSAAYGVTFGDGVSLPDPFGGDEDPTDIDATTGEATVSRVDPTTARGNLAKTLIGQWAVDKYPLYSGYNPVNWVRTADNEHEEFLNSAISEAAVLLEQDFAKPEAERNPAYANYNITPGARNDFEAVWADASAIVLEKMRAANIENALVSAYREMLNKDDNYNPRTGEFGENFDQVLPMLLRDQSIGDDPWDTNSALFIEKVREREASLSPDAIENRTAAALKGFADGRSVTLNDVTDAEIRAAQILANQFDLASNNFHSEEFLSGAAGSDLRAETLEQATTVLTREVAAAEAAARTQAALTAFANDRGARIEDLTAAEEEAAEMLAESGQSLDFISGNTAESKNYRQVLLDGATEALTAIQQTPSGGGGSGPNIRDVDFPQGPGAMTNALGNALNWATDGDNDGYGAIITHPVGQAISATAIATGKSLSRGFGAISDDAQGWLKYAGIGLGGAFMLRFLPGMGWTRNGLAFLIVAGLVGVLASKATHGGLDNAFADDGDGSTGDGSTGDGQGDGGFLAPDAVGHQVRTMAHDGQLPQIITITGDFDDDGDMDFINFFDKDRDGIYAAQMQGQSGKESFASAEIFTSAFIQGKFDLSPSNMALSTGTAKAGTDIQFGFIPHSSGDSISAGTLEIGDRNFMLDDRLDRDMTAGVLKGIEDANVPQTSLIQ